MSVYNDQNMSLKILRLTQFELASEIPAAIELFAKNHKPLIYNRECLLSELMQHYITSNQWIKSLAISD